MHTHGFTDELEPGGLGLVFVCFFLSLAVASLFVIWLVIFITLKVVFML